MQTTLAISAYLMTSGKYTDFGYVTWNNESGRLVGPGGTLSYERGGDARRLS